MGVLDRIVLPEEDAAALDDVLAALRSSSCPEITLEDGTRVRLPSVVIDVVRDVAEVLASGQAVTVIPQDSTLTTQQAADLLGMSRPTLVKLLEDGQIPFTQPGRHRRLRLRDVLAYRDRVRQGRARGLDELAAASQDAGLYDDEVIVARLRR